MQFIWNVVRDTFGLKRSAFVVKLQICPAAFLFGPSSFAAEESACWEHCTSAALGVLANVGTVDGIPTVLVSLLMRVCL